jgi:hypothetical protein
LKNKDFAKVLFKFQERAQIVRQFCKKLFFFFTANLIIFEASMVNFIHKQLFMIVTMCTLLLNPAMAQMFLKHGELDGPPSALPRYNPADKYAFSYLQSSKHNSQFSITPLELEQGLRSKIHAVPEFKIIKNEAKRLGVKVYLFGDSALAFANYVKSDLLSQKGDHSYILEKLDYDFKNIFYSTQVMEVVVDGNESQVKQMSKFIESQFAQIFNRKMPGSKKVVWDVRPYKTAKSKIGAADYREALLENHEYLNQNLDSVATGLVDITEDPDNLIVLDLQDMKSKENKFLRDLAAEKIIFYRSRLHEETPLYEAGINPEIISVIKTLTRTFQFELYLEDSTLIQIKNIIFEFDPNAKLNPQAQAQIIHLGKNLIRHAANAEKAWDALEKLGLRKKLSKFDSAFTPDALSWWLYKEPLRRVQLAKEPSQENGNYKLGKSAKELSLNYVVYDAQTFENFELINKSLVDDPKLFLGKDSKDKTKSLNSMGFYTKVYVPKMTLNPLEIKFQVNPLAKEGADFILTSDGGSQVKNKVIIKNKAALIIASENNLGWLDYFREFYEEKEKLYDNYYNPNLKSRLKNLFTSKQPLDFYNQEDYLKSSRIKQKLERSKTQISPEEEAEVVKIVKEGIEKALDWQKVNPNYGGAFDQLFVDWFALPQSFKYPDVLNEVIDEMPNSEDLIYKVLKYKHWSEYNLVNEKLMIDKLNDSNYRTRYRLMLHTLNLPEWNYRPKVFIELYKRDSFNFLNFFKEKFDDPKWTDFPEVMEHVLSYADDKSVTDGAMFLRKKHWTRHPYLIEMYLKKHEKFAEKSVIMRKLLALDHWRLQPQLVALVQGIGDETVNVENLFEAFAQGRTIKKPDADDLTCKVVFEK